ncbi:MAG: hypothetical protein UT19_C0009G0034 [Candidatus Woesebacteria bacterium GW2011_GWB1_39_10b]|uniref:HD/PDEase domain-containing protein n=2 Tax=Candidatus Woeseibacteriota TaxID=1752722 RepID=A0A0G0ND74_9BACT|nr:MAG: hypothetical protein US72_C0004G0014 [Microgenomates group bacterium GW2011_GWC1_38_12]KKQ93625.1 MAG: hypothetical protein UT19_C0009G0034 [Candidatus Woesebacteria bacterium GW2011_GWB1_39_10b]KKR13453.1 MAG: hypothetical protein UT40_C0017G0039 [Candidatus Woesebacteria bacterium GW2011_GWA1_39_21b]
MNKAIDPKNVIKKLKNLDTGKKLAELMAGMANIDTKSKEAKENVYSMRDNSGNKIIYMLTQDLLKEATKTKKDIKMKWVELLVKQRLLKQLFGEAKKILENNKRFHDYGHAVEVILNVEELLKAGGRSKYDVETLWASALFHDASNSQDKEREGKDGAKIAEAILQEIKDFPQDKIKEVKRLIESIDREPETDDEVLITTADEMAALSPLGLVRSMMISGNRNMLVKDALEWELNYIDKRYKRLRLENAKKIVKLSYQQKRQFLLSCLSNYEV